MCCGLMIPHTCIYISSIVCIQLGTVVCGSTIEESHNEL